jgi:GntR family transcriptional regulator
VILEIDTSSPVPPYEQIRVQLAELVTSGELPEGTRLPTIRQLAGDLGLAPGTVARAYRELESAGIVKSRVRHGTTVCRPARPSARQVRDGIAAAARSYALAIRALGMSRDEAVAALDRELAERAGTLER